MTGELPREAAYVVVGGGTSGNVVAARLAEAGHDVLVLEAGPDFGPQGSEAWPADLLDATRLGTSADWGYDSGDTLSEPMRFERTRAIGGCSATNGTTQTWGHRADYDEWAAAGNPGWAMADLMPFFVEATRRMRVKDYLVAELSPWQAAWYDACPAAGIPQRSTLNDMDEGPAVAPESNNIVDGIRYNTAFGYLDPVRALPNLRIAGDALVDSVIVEHGRAVGVRVMFRGRMRTVAAGTVILSGGAYNSPQVLQRSGIASPDLLDRLDIPLVHALPGVGENLHDQPFMLLSWSGTPEMERAMAAARAVGFTPDEQMMAKAASSMDPDVFDLHILPYSPTHSVRKRWSCGVSALRPRSRGWVRIVSRDPESKPHIDHRFYSDAEGHDARVVAEGMQLLRRMAAEPAMRALVGTEIHPGPAAGATLDELARYATSHPDNYWHPVGSCRMGPATDPGAVVDARGRVHGIEGLLVADCSIMPTIPRATTAMPAVVVGERIASFLIAE